MRRDTALAAAIAAAIGYAVLVGVTSSHGPKQAIGSSKPVAFLISYADSADAVRITDPIEVASIASWLDETLEARRSPFDLRRLPAPEHTLEAEFEGRERIAFHFSMPTATPAPVLDSTRRAARRQERLANLTVLEYGGTSYTSEQIPRAIRRRHGEQQADAPEFGPLRGERKQTTED